MFVSFHGNNYAIQDQYLAVIQNPSAPKYPKSGDIIQQTGRVLSLMPDGEYLILMVEEFIPPHDKDEDGRDIRLTLVDEDGDQFTGMNGYNIRKHLVHE